MATKHARRHTRARAHARTHARTYRTGKAENLRMQTLASAPAHRRLISCNQLLEVHVVASLDGFALLVLWYGVK